MITTSMGEMIRRGIITGERKNYYKGVHVCSFAGGDRALYETMRDTPNLRIVPGSYGVDPMTIMQNDNMVSINTILEMDLTGQVCSESIGPRQHSGSGGGFCFAYGALRSKGGRGILAFASRSKKGMPKIKPILTPGAVVTIPRNYVDYIVTEYGVAHLRGCNVKERCEQLISIAHPDDRLSCAKRLRSCSISDFTGRLIQKTAGRLLKGGGRFCLVRRPLARILPALLRPGPPAGARPPPSRRAAPGREPPFLPAARAPTPRLPSGLPLCSGHPGRSGSNPRSLRSASPLSS